ncbi:MAG: DUF501 domain-containing protein, partial [Microthrixaceae bacterium]
SADLGSADLGSADLGSADLGSADPDDVAAVAELLGRSPKGSFKVLLRSADGTPMVIANQPLLDDGTPMPTRYWLLDKKLNRRIGQLESTGGVRQAEAAVDAADLVAAHNAYAAERDALIPASWTGPRPFGGVGGTRRGVKCLHTHYAWFLVGGDDPVGRWVDDRLAQSDQTDGIDTGLTSTVQDKQNPKERGVRT